MPDDPHDWLDTELAAGRYRVTAKLGQGGMGAVYRAHDANLDCDVVIKVPHPLMLQQSEFAQRFAQEIRSLVTLSHPHIVKIIDVGARQGTPFAVMSYLAGGDLQQRRPQDDRGKSLPMSAASLSQWLPAVAEALDFVHKKGYLHRDIKPANIIFDDNGYAHVSDFGIVKAFVDSSDSEQTSGLTGTGMILGTADYMAPEIVVDKPYDGRADQYSLAVTVYELLTGQRPFAVTTPAAALVAKATQHAPALSTIAPSLSRPLCEAVDRALSRDPQERFASCTEFAEAALFNSDRSHSANQTATQQRTKTIPSAAPLVEAEIVRSSEKPTLMQDRVTLKLSSSAPEGRVKESQQTIESVVSWTAERAKQAVAKILSTSRALARAPRWVLAAVGGAAALSVALLALVMMVSFLTSDSNLLDPDWIERRLAEGGVDALLSDYEEVTRSDEKTVRAALHLSQHVLRENPDELRMQLQARMVDRQSSKLKPFQSLPEGAGVQLLSLWPTFDRAGGPLQRTYTGHADMVLCVAISPDGRTAISGSWNHSLKVWDLQTGREKRTLTGHAGGVICVAITPDGKTLVSGSMDKTLIVWNLETGKQVRTLTGLNSDVGCVAITPDGRTVISGALDNTLNVWDLETGKRKRTITGHTGSVNCLAITPDGKTVVSGSMDKTLRVWDLETGKQIQTFTGHTDHVNCLTIAPDGRTVLSGSMDKSLRVWDLVTGKQKRTLTGHTAEVRCVAITPDGQTVVSGSNDDTLRVWDFETGQQKRTLTERAISVYCVAITPDARTVISGSFDKTLRVWDLQAAQQKRSLGHPNGVDCLAITSDGQTALSGSSGDTLRIWDLVTRKQRRFLKSDSNNFNLLAITPDARTIVTSSANNTLHSWDLKTAKQKRTFTGHTSSLRCVAITPDGRTVVSGSMDKTLRVWDLETGQQRLTLTGHTETVYCVAITPDSQTAVSGGSDKSLRVWNLKTGKEIRTYNGHYDSVNNVAIAPDGRTVVSSSDELLKVWDLETGKQSRMLMGHTETVTCVAITPDGRMVVSGSRDKTLKLWDIQTGQQRCALHLDATPMECAISRDGQTLVVGDSVGRIYKFHIQ